MTFGAEMLSHIVQPKGINDPQNAALQARSKLKEGSAKDVENVVVARSSSWHVLMLEQSRKVQSDDD
jgi:hypothetical protein